MIWSFQLSFIANVFIAFGYSLNFFIMSLTFYLLAEKTLCLLLFSGLFYFLLSAS